MSSNKRKENYGTPVEGSKTEMRAKTAHQRISNEIVQLIIEQRGGNGKSVKFGELFRIYTVISNKVVGVLLRARRHGLVHFEGETLFQGRDDDVEITLLKSVAEIKDDRNSSKDFQWGKCM